MHDIVPKFDVHQRKVLFDYKDKNKPYKKKTKKKPESNIAKKSVLTIFFVKLKFTS